VTQPYTGYDANGKRGVQSGSGVLTKLSLKNFHAYTDTIPNLVFNSAEIIINNVDAVGSYYTPTLVMAMLRENNKPFTIRRTNKTDSTADANTVATFRGLLQAQSTVYAASADNVSSPFSMAHNVNSNSFSGFCTLFFQELYYLKKSGQTFENFALYPLVPLQTKSVYRTGFNADQIKLRLYYTRPLTSQ
jgi:hypothetical protein